MKKKTIALAVLGALLALLLCLCGYLKDAAEIPSEQAEPPRSSEPTQEMTCAPEEEMIQPQTVPEETDSQTEPETAKEPAETGPAKKPSKSDAPKATEPPVTQVPPSETPATEPPVTHTPVTEPAVEEPSIPANMTDKG